MRVFLFRWYMVLVSLVCRCIALTVSLWLASSILVVAQTGQLTEQRPDSVYQSLKTRLDQAITRNERRAEADSRQELGMFFYRQGDYTQAIQWLLDAQKIFRASNQPNRLASNLNELGTVYYFNRQPKLARRQFDEALLIYGKTNNAGGLARTYTDIGHLYEKQGQPDQAFRYQKLALATARPLHNPAGLERIYENIGSIFEDRRQYDSARYYYQKALAISQQTRQESSQLEIIDNLGDIFRKTNRYANALTMYRHVIRRARQQGEKYQLNGVYRDMYKTFQLLNQPDSAYRYFELSYALTGEIYATNNARQIALLQTQFEVTRKDDEIARLNAEKRVNTVLLAGGGLVLLLLAGLGAVVISRQRLKIRNERLLNETSQQVLRTQNELMQAELQNKQLASENLTYQLKLKSQELTSHTLHIIQKNQVLEDLRDKLTTILNDDKRDQRKQLKQVVKTIGESFSQDKTWDDFRATFDQVHPDFFSNLTRQFPDLSSTDLRLMALLKMNMGSADMATLLGISPDSLRVSRYRLRKKLNMAEGESLSGFVQRQ